MQRFDVDGALAEPFRPNQLIGLVERMLQANP